MSGNIWEWCSTVWVDNYEEYEAKVTENLEGDASRVLRGCSFGSDDYSARCASRNNYGGFPLGRFNGIGFRVLLPGSVSLLSENSVLEKSLCSTL